MNPNAQRDAARTAAWLPAVRAAIRRGASTPFYLFRTAPVAEALAGFGRAGFGMPVRHWLSCKTQPVPALLEWWRRQMRPVEVVSEFELRAALAAGFDAESILVNGPAKHRWLPPLSRLGLRVHFDSTREAAALLPLARRDKWRVGVRIRTGGEHDPAHPDFPTQFGMEPAEAVAWLGKHAGAGIPVESVHFHLRTNVASPKAYADALRDVAEVCRAARFTPRFLDAGGGLPPPFTRSPSGRAYDTRMDLHRLAAMFNRELKQFPALEELWLENGRFLLARSGVLVVTILDAKQHRGFRRLICDGGRTMNALVSQWEIHDLEPLLPRPGRRLLTAVHGPTCMAFDLLARKPLPAALRPGDRLVWFDAGAYHVSWETRFSHGLAEVWWEDEASLRRIREAETFEGFTGRWKV